MARILPRLRQTQSVVCGQRLARGDEAIAYLDEALALFGRMGDLNGQAWTLDNLGTVHNRHRRYRTAARYLERALALFREIGDRDGEPWSGNGLGEVARAEGRPADAHAYHLAALAVASGSGARDQQARAHAGLGYAARALGDPAATRAHLTTALALYTQLGMPEADEVRRQLEVGWRDSAVAPPPSRGDHAGPASRPGTSGNGGRR
jgi:tetratricopeptide (TPR) repeat protein